MNWSSAKKWLAPIAAVIVGCGVVGIVATRQHPPANTSSPIYVKPLAANEVGPNSMVDPGTPLYGHTAPAFTLTNQFGKQVSLSQFRGKTVVLSFDDAVCTTICPLTTEDMMNAVKTLGPKAAKDIQLLGIDANPQAISVNDVMKYSKDHGMMHSWDFLTGTLPQLKQVWKNYNIEAQVVNDQIDHTPALYIIDPQGKERVLYLTPSTYSSVAAETSILAKDIKKYLPARDGNPVKQVTAQPVTWSPKNTMSLPTVKDGKIDGSVIIGQGKPTLVAFFASWAPNAKIGLEQLDAYSKQPGAPKVIGVDVETTEPNQSWFLNWEKGVHTPDIPIAIDKTGEVADGFKIADLMWISLVNANGKIVWSNDGWIPTKQIQEIVNRKLHPNQPAS